MFTKNMASTRSRLYTRTLGTALRDATRICDIAAASPHGINLAVTENSSKSTKIYRIR